MHRATHRRAYSRPIPRRNLRGATNVRGANTVRNPRGVRSVRATATATANGSTLVLPRVSAETWKAVRPKVLALAVVLLFGSLVFAFFNFDSFYVFEPDVIGLENLTKDQVIRASGITGYNVFFVDAGSVERALSKMPEIKSARVIPGLPNRLSIQIAEREPTVAWQRGGDRYWVDADGVVFQAHGDMPELTTIRDLDQTPLKSGTRVTRKALDAYQALRTAMPEAPLLLDWSNARGLGFTNERGWKIYLGDENEMTGKVVKYRALVQQLGAEKAQVKFIDLGKGDPYYQ